MTAYLPPNAWDQFQNQLTTNPTFIKKIEDAKTIPIFYTNFHEITNIFAEHATQAKELLHHEPQNIIPLMEQEINKTATDTSAFKIPEPIKLNIEYPQLENTPINTIRQKHLYTNINIEGIITIKTDLNILNLRGIYTCTNPQCQQQSTRTKETNRDLRQTIRCDKCDNPMTIEKINAQDQIYIYIDEPYETTHNATDIKKTIIQLQNQYTHPELEKRLTHGTRIRVYGYVDIIKTKKTQQYIIIPYGITIIGNELDIIKPTHQDLQTLQQIQQQQPLPTYFRKNIFPNIIKNDKFIEAAIVATIGAPAKTDGIDYQRGNPNMIAIGDRSLSKSKIFTILHNLIPKHRIVNAGTTTGPGMTATTIKDELTGQYMLHPGAILLADGSVITIEEIGRMDKETLNALHYVMESGKLPINKGGHNIEIPCETTITATGNPPGGVWDRTKPYSTQLPCEITFIDRFDIVYLLTDTADEETDGQIYDAYQQNQKIPQHTAELFRKYWILAKRINTQINEEARQYGRQFYQTIRKTTNAQGLPHASARTANGIQRIAIARARSQLKTTATIEDMQWAIDIYTEGRKPILEHDGQIQYNELFINDASKNQTTIKTEILRHLTTQPATQEELLTALQQTPTLRHIHPFDLQIAINKLSNEKYIMENPANTYRLI